MGACRISCNADRFGRFLNWMFSLVSTPDPSGLIPSENYARLWMLFAFIFGMQFGMNVYECLAYVVKASIGGYRTERLLLAMYDARDDNQQGETDGLPTMKSKN